MTDQTSERFVDDANRYRLDSRIATGGMGEVWRATDTALGREVAVKVLKAEYADDPAFRQRFAIEARHAAALHHPGVAGVFDFGEAHSAGADDGSGVPRPFLVMELVEGEPLSTLLRRGLESGRTLDRDAVRDLLAQAGDAIGAAHLAGIVHRDVKPANMMVTPSGQLKVTDFGIARAADGAGITQTGAVMGTPQYLSPEQAQGQPATPRSDVYSLGVVAFECLAGRRPFDADSPIATALAHIREPVPDLPADVPDDLAAVVRRALAKDPAERYADGGEFAAALRDPATELLRTPPVAPPVVPVGAADAAAGATAVLSPTAAGATAAPPPTPPSTPASPAAAAGDRRAGRRRPWLAVLLGLLGVALAAAVVLLVTSGGDDPDAPPTYDSPRPSKTQQPTRDDTPTEAPSESATTESPEETSAPPSEDSDEPTASPTTPSSEPTEAPTTEATTPPTEPSQPTEPTTPTTSTSQASSPVALPSTSAPAAATTP